MTDAWPGAPFPLGATWDGEGVNFSLFSEHATAVELCLFDERGREERVALEERTAFNWHGYLPGIAPGQRYGYRVQGPPGTADGHRFDRRRLLIDPYARAIEGPVRWSRGRARTPFSIVIDPAFDWEDDRRPRTPMHESVFYEVHVKGYTKRHPDVPEHLRGTYAGLASDEAIRHLKDLGVTGVELLPVHHIADEWFLPDRGLTNYWGYSSVGFFAPHSEYAATGRRGEQVREFKGMVKALHRNGIEVILDVVYNHTGESDERGPTLSMRGIDNRSYYRLAPEDPARYLDFTGTGNTLNILHPSVLQLVMDSLRYWVLECHVDGFRFDLAAALARETYDFNRLSAFLDAIHQDPVLSQVKLLAEPWDTAPGGYQVGNFPVIWAEWNGKYRDVMRDFWRGHATVGEFASRLTGSSDVFGDDGRHPWASVNFVTAHDGFTLADLVAYDRKHNAANGEDNRDGSDDNRSWSFGVEGPTDDPEILESRARQQRNLLATLLLSIGTPMLLGGDELGRTQGGNNNPWCQDNEIAWFDWTTSPEQESLTAFTRRLIALRREHPVFRRRHYLTGLGTPLPDAAWLAPDGGPMREWHSGPPAVALFLNGEQIISRDARGGRVVDDSFLLLFNAQATEQPFTLPDERLGARWALELSTAAPERPSGAFEAPAGDALTLVPRSLIVLRRIA